MTGFIRREPFALSAAGLNFPVSRYASTPAFAAFADDPSIREVWRPDINYGKVWRGAKAGIPATLIEPTGIATRLPDVLEDNGGYAYAKWGSTNLTPAVFSTPAESALYPIDASYTLIGLIEMSSTDSNVGAFFANARSDTSQTSGVVTGGAWFGIGVSNGAIYGHHQTRNAGVTAAPLINSNPDFLYPTGRHWFALSFNRPTNTMRLIVDGAVVRSNTNVTKQNENSQLYIGGRLTDAGAFLNAMRATRVHVLSVANTAYGEAANVAQLAKLSAYAEPWRLAA